MDPERFKRLEELYHAADGLRPEGRERFLDEQCGADAALRALVARLLSYDDTTLGGALNAPVFGSEACSTADAARNDPVRIGNYTVRGVIGSGGMGVVYEAEQQYPRRTVALKVIRQELDSAPLHRRLRREANVLARLQHPGIAQVYEAGVAEVETRRGVVGTQPYVALELVRGRPLAEYARANQLDIPQRLELVAEVCDAVHYAHENDVIHRDLKPANIVVDETHGPKVLDFGVARIASSDPGQSTVHTEAGQLLGTVAYMSPEHLREGPGSVDRRGDVYSLGIILYELLTGRLPYDQAADSIAVYLHRMSHDEPAPLGRTNRRLRGDIEIIVGKALETDKKRRYQTARDLGDDIRRHLGHEPILARRPSTAYRARKFAKRHTAVVAALVILTIGIVTTGLALLRATANARDARRQTYRACIAAATEAMRADDAATARRFLAVAPQELRGWEWDHLTSRTDTCRRLLTGHTAAVTCVVFHPDGKTVLSASSDSTVRRWTVDGGHLVGSPLATAHAVSAMAIRPDTDQVALGLTDGTIEIRGADRWALHDRLTFLTDEVSAISFEKSGETIAATSFDKTLGVWDLNERRLIMTGTHDDKATGVAFLPDDVHVVTSCWEGNTYVWDLESGKLVDKTERHVHIIYDLSLSPDGAHLATAAGDHSSAVIESNSGNVVQRLRRHAGHVRSLAFSPDGRRIATGGNDATIRLWEIPSGQQLAVLNGHTDSVVSLAFSQDGQLLASGSDDGTVRLWETEIQRADSVLQENEQAIYPVAFSPDGTFLAAGSWDTNVHIWDPVTGCRLGSLAGHKKEITALSISPDSRLIATASADDTARIWMADGTEKAILVGHSDDLEGVAFGPDGRWLATAAIDRTVRLWDAETGRQLAELREARLPLCCVAVSPNGKWIAAGCTNGQIAVWATRDVGVPFWFGESREHSARVHSVAFSPDSKQLLSAGADRTMVMRDVRTLETQRLFRGHTGIVYGIAFSPDGERIASGSDDQTIRVWNPRSDDVLAVLRGHTEYVYSVAFSPDGRWLASGSGDGTVRLWDSRFRRDATSNEH